ncbi:hypothetical protein U1Q18_025865 [Sarracenia purpurea var. burkii]
MHNRTERNEDRGDQRMKGLTVFTGRSRPIRLVTRDGEMYREFRDAAHWFLLYNSPELENYLEDGVEDHATIVIGSSTNVEGDNSDCEEDGERHDIPDVVIDVDMDYDNM